MHFLQRHSSYRNSGASYFCPRWMFNFHINNVLLESSFSAITRLLFRSSHCNGSSESFTGTVLRSCLNAPCLESCADSVLRSCLNASCPHLESCTDSVDEWPTFTLPTSESSVPSTYEIRTHSKLLYFHYLFSIILYNMDIFTHVVY